MAAPVASTSVSAGGLVSAASKAKPAGKQLGTLVVVVIKARNLPNKQRIGKQDPYCSITIGHQKQKTPAVKRGGQTPHWDSQLQFEIWEESADKVPVVATETGGIGPSSALGVKKDEDLLPGQATVGRAKPKNASADASKRLMKIACYADDPREPELIGETEVDYAPTLKKGEFDEWVEIKHKGKYAGEVFIEMTFYSAAPPPVKRKSKPMIPGSGYGGPGHFEPLPDTFPQSPVNTATTRPPSTHLSPSPAQPLRMSQSQYSLNSSTLGRPVPSASPSLDEFGRRRQPTPVAFPTPHQGTSSSATSDASYNPPYAPPSLAPSASSSHLVKPHRASFSSYGMTQHDIDSMLRPLSSLSIGGGSVNKPLPMPQPAQQQQQQPYRPPPSPARPLSGMGQGMAMAPHPTPSPRPYPVSPPLPQPGMQHHHSQPVTQPYQPPQHEQYADPHPHLPSHHHRHSMTTYLPDGSEVPWDNNQIPHHQPQAQEIGLHNPPPPANDVRPTYGRAQGSWHDPRAASPYQPQSSTTPYQDPPVGNQAYGLASPSQSASSHPSSLQPGTSPLFSSLSQQYQKQAMSPPQGLQSPLHPQSTDAPVWNNAQHYSSPVLGDAFQQNPPHDQAGQYDGYNQTPHQQQYQEHQGVQYDHQGQYQQHQNEQPQYGYDQGPSQAAYDQQPVHQQYDNGYHQDGYAQQADAGGYHQAPPPPSAADPYAYQQGGSSLPPPTPQVNHLNQDHRTSSPYRPLPQPTPEPSQQPSYNQYNQSPAPHPQHQQGQQGQYPPQPQAPPPRQPRFGLPPHQPYDPPYIPPSSRQSQHQSSSPYALQQPAYQQQPDQQNQQYSHHHHQGNPPPIPPVPHELKQDQYNNAYGYR